MTKFNKGDRVHSSIYGDGTVLEVKYDFVQIRLDNHPIFAGAYDLWHSDSPLDVLTKITDPAPLRFEDVKTGDKIWVDAPDYKIAGTAYRGDLGSVTIGGYTYDDFDGDTAASSGHEHRVTLTAHKPKPEWHRALVIKADIPKVPDEGVFLLGGGFGTFSDGVTEYYPSDLINVEVIVNERREVVR